ncbi:MAG: C4-dicarboxylate ABC transporter permease [Martelella sp.]|nr:C4-dicarboxylate ABC transporter permease [Martelella sp.]|tara:strand:+ start:1632 stop:2189 length:558 start_codon:yes stop_codon:yes gene_type:complete
MHCPDRKSCAASAKGEPDLRELAGTLSAALNRVVDAVVVILLAALVLDVWIGVLDRYIFHWQFNWPEIMARYLMIWVALLAISCGIARRDHIGLTILIDRFPVTLRRAILIGCDLLALALFVWTFIYGLQFAISGASRFALIFGMSMAPAFAAVPTAAALASVQLLLCLVRDAGQYTVQDQAAEV